MNISHLAGRLDHIAPFHVMELTKMAAALEQQGRSMVYLGIGEPDFTATPAVIAAATAAMTNGCTQYTAATGLPALREAISSHYARVYGLDIDPSRIVITAGASAALVLACAALVEPGDKVLMPDPSYPCNRHFVAAFGAEAKMLPCGPEQRFQLSDHDVRTHWDEHTRGVLLASPSNPTGTSIAPDELKKILQTVQDKRGFAIVDEIYQGLTYDAAPFSALSLSDDVVVVNSFSKYFNMTGWRLGWLVVPPALLPAIEKLAQNLFICASTIAQHAAIACFAPESIALYEQRKAEFRRRRDYVVCALRDLNFIVPVEPDGAFYVYADCSQLSNDADQLTRDMILHAGVVLVPGLDFGPATAHRYIRVSYATSMANLEEAMRRLAVFFQRAQVA